MYIEYFDRDLEEEILYRFSELKDIEVALQEFKRFFFISIHLFGIEEKGFQNSIEYLPVSSEIDEIWHYCILQTYKYKKLCESILPNAFLHHRSSNLSSLKKESHEQLNQESEAQLNVLLTYIDNFGIFTEETLPFWPSATALQRRMGWTVLKLNKFLSNLNVEI